MEKRIIQIDYNYEFEVLIKNTFNNIELINKNLNYPFSIDLSFEKYLRFII